ncbi:hypothetical protein J6590_015223 [Homalodisca vitripennis]|nr:hypothetical protein J6590_015223 [Homalodisca vitripennis]
MWRRCENYLSLDSVYNGIKSGTAGLSWRLEETWNITQRSIQSLSPTFIFRTPKALAHQPIQFDFFRRDGGQLCRRQNKNYRHYFSRILMWSEPTGRLLKTLLAGQVWSNLEDFSKHKFTIRTMTTLIPRGLRMIQALHILHSCMLMRYPGAMNMHAGSAQVGQLATDAVSYSHV